MDPCICELCRGLGAQPPEARASFGQFRLRKTSFGKNMHEIVYIIGHNYHGNYSHARGLYSVNNYIGENNVLDISMSVNNKVRVFHS